MYMTETGMIDWENNYFKIHGEPKNLKIDQKVLGAVVAPYYYHNNQKRFVLINIQRKDGEKHYEFPRGFCKPLEDFKDTAKRELKEETNLNARSVNYLGLVMPDSGLLSSKIRLYSAEVTEDDIAHIRLQKSEKISGVTILSLDELKEKIRKDVIVDGYTIACTMHIDDQNDIKCISSNVTVADSISEM